MTKENFIKTHGDEPRGATKNYATKSLGTNYDIKDAFIEFGDNANDAKLIEQPLNFDININNNESTIVFSDNGTGIEDDTKLFMLGGTNKEHDKNKIGKYGIGVPGAVAAIATKCVHDKNKLVEVIFNSSCNGKEFEKHIAIEPNGDMIIGETKYFDCDIKKHCTVIKFTNVKLIHFSEIIEALEETFEEPLQKNMNISFNGRQLGKTGHRTFIGDESIETIMVGNFAIDVKYRIIGGSKTSDERSFEEAGLRVYDKESGRLLAKSNDLWFWYGNRKAQPNICGLRAAIYIESSIECYNKFGIKPTKNGVTYGKYYKRDVDFANLSGYLASIYTQASKTSPNIQEDKINIGNRSFQVAQIKIDQPYVEVSNNNFLIKKKYTSEEIAELINEIITLRKKQNKK